MEDTEKGLKEVFSGIFNGQGQRLSMMSKLVLAVLKTCTINYAQLALVINVKVKIESNFKRIQRFMKSYRFVNTVMFNLPGRFTAAKVNVLPSVWIVLIGGLERSISTF